MIKIQVLGHGLIPRGQGIAPRREPFDADLDTIKSILNAGGLKINAINPITGAVVPITSNNLMKMWCAFNNVSKPAASDAKAPVLRPATPEKKVDIRSNPEPNPQVSQGRPPVTEQKTPDASDTQKKSEDRRPDHQDRRDNNGSNKPNDGNKGNNNGTLKVVSNPNEK